MNAVATIGGIAIYDLGDALRYTTGMRIDGDGGRHTYRVGPGGLDYIGNAHKDPRDATSPWVGIVLGPDGQPIADTEGFLLSPTALVDRTKALGDPDRYVDAELVPYGSIPPELEALGACLGDLMLMEYRGVGIAGLAADIGPHRKIGEASEATAKALAIPSSPKNGGVEAGVTYTIWKGSRATPAWPRSLDDIAAEVEQLRAGRAAVA